MDNSDTLTTLATQDTGRSNKNKTKQNLKKQTHNRKIK